eukprot:9488825-Pyramimonas_sp.AAC.1
MCPAKVIPLMAMRPVNTATIAIAFRATMNSTNLIGTPPPPSHHHRYDHHHRRWHDRRRDGPSVLVIPNARSDRSWPQAVSLRNDFTCLVMR